MNFVRVEAGVRSVSTVFASAVLAVGHRAKGEGGETDRGVRNERPKTTDVYEMGYARRLGQERLL